MTDLNKKQQKTLQKIFDSPTRSDIEWNEVRSLLKACHAEIHEGKGSRVRITLNKRVLNIHSPHPQKELRKYAVELVRGFLQITGIKK